MPKLPSSSGLDITRRRHAEWAEHQARWRFLADSYEGGNRYRRADYQIDPVYETGGADWPAGRQGGGYPGLGGSGGDPATGQPAAPFGYNQIVDRNLVPHRSEMSPDGSETYLMRLARTPVPKLMERTIRRHLSRIYAREVDREGGPELTGWWEDVDGLATPIDKWMRKVVAPLLLTYGQLDLAFDHPAADPDLPEPATRADAAEMGLDRCIASYILPENMLWWRLDARRRYVECTVLERDDDGCPRFRHWDCRGWALYAKEGELLGRDIHPFGRPPIVRIFDERKLRCRNVGQPRYESIAEYQRAIYNGDSELILQDVFQATPTLQGSEEYLTGDQQIAVGPGKTLPIKVTADGANVIPWSYVAKPPGAADDLTHHLESYADQADRDAALSKPAGMVNSGTTGQSGLSKAFDGQEGNDYLSEVSETLADAERGIADMALLVLGSGRIDPAESDAATITYPREFDLFTAEDIASAAADLVQLADAAGALPQIQGEVINRLVRAMFPGIDDGTLARFGEEIDLLMGQKAADREAGREAMARGRAGGEEDDDGEDAGRPAVPIGLASPS